MGFVGFYGLCEILWVSAEFCRTLRVWVFLLGFAEFHEFRVLMILVDFAGYILLH